MILMLRRDWPGAMHRTLLRAGQEPEKFSLLPGQPIEVDDAIGRELLTRGAPAIIEVVLDDARGEFRGLAPGKQAPDASTRVPVEGLAIVDDDAAAAPTNEPEVLPEVLPEGRVKKSRSRRNESS